MDLSTGINPNGWPIPEIPAQCWQRLPESSDGLIAAAKDYYQCHSILAVAGSQAAIQALPLLRTHSKVGVLSPAYAEHGYSWKKSAHQVIELCAQTIDSKIDQLDVLIIVNPNNPTAQQFSTEQLLAWHQRLNQRNGWLIVDEAFMDSTPENSLSNQSTKGLIILRSIGKFFGLAGIRSGFVIADGAILNALNEKLGPWTISHPSRFIATQALQDDDWQQNTLLSLKKQSEKLSQVLSRNSLKTKAKTDLFQWIQTAEAQQIQHSLAKQGILSRLFTQPLSIRFGLPKNEQQLLRLDKALQFIQHKPTKNLV
jgi:cobalamin biosynthetic protein CobC